jgi:hypothetical protein
MTTAPSEKLLAILQDHFTSREDGWIWHATYIDGSEHGVVNQIEGAYDEPIEFAGALSEIINGLDSFRSYLALCRPEGRPTEADRTLWRELRRLANPDALVDLVVFNADDVWSMREEDAAAAVK